MERDYSTNNVYYSQVMDRLPVENRTSENWRGNQFGNYQVSCDYQNGHYSDGNVAREFQTNVKHASSITQAQQFSREYVPFTQMYDSSCNAEYANYSAYSAGKQDFDPRSVPGHKRSRTVFQPHQIRRLQYEFEREMYMVGVRRRNLSKELDLSEKQIKIWFQNRRMKQKRERNRKRRGGLETFQNAFGTNTAGNYFQKYPHPGFPTREITSESRNIQDHQSLML